jgi:hypothetical protein
MFPLMGHDDRENMTRIWQMVMPLPFRESDNSSKKRSAVTGRAGGTSYPGFITLLNH